MFTSLWRDHRSLLGVLALALLLRAAVLWRYAPMLDEDRDLYRQIAEQLAAGKGYSRPLRWVGFPPQHTFTRALETKDHSELFWVSGDVVPDAPIGQLLDFPTAYRPPLYPMLVAGTLAVFQSHRAIAVIHLLLGIATVGCTILAARRMNLNRFATWAGVGVAADPLLLYHTPQLMTETLAAFLTAGLLLAATLPKTWRRQLSVGILLGLAGLCRPTYFAVAGLWVLCELLPSNESILRDRFRHAIWIGIAVFLVSSPWAIRNRFVLGHWIFATTHGGYTLLLGHNRYYTTDVVNGPWVTGWQKYNRMITLLELYAFGELDSSSIPEFEIVLDRRYSRGALQYMRSDPWTAVRSGLTLWRRMWSVVPQQTEGVSLPVRTGIGLFYGVTFALAGLGLLSLFRSDWSGWLPVLALIIGFTAVHFFYWADMRMRTPLTPAIALLAARGASRFVRRGTPR